MSFGMNRVELIGRLGADVNGAGALRPIGARDRGSLASLPAPAPLAHTDGPCPAAPVAPLRAREPMTHHSGASLRFRARGSQPASKENVMHGIENIDTQNQSVTATICENAQLFGAAPERGEFDPRDVWDRDDALAAVGEAFRILAEGVGPDGTQLADERESLLWGFVNCLDAQVRRLDRGVDRLSPELRDLQSAQDGTEVKSRELELVTDRAQNLGDRRDAFETMRDAAADAYRSEIGDVWRPRRGSNVSQTGKLGDAAADDDDDTGGGADADVADVADGADDGWQCGDQVDESGRVASRPGYPAEPAERSRPFGRVSLAPPFASLISRFAWPAARCAPRRCRNDTLVARFDGVVAVTALSSSRRRCAPRSSRCSPRSPWPAAPAAGIAPARFGDTPCLAGAGFAVHRLAHSAMHHPAHRCLRSCARSCGASAHVAPHRAGQSCSHRCGQRRRRYRRRAAHDPVQLPLHFPPAQAPRRLRCAAVAGPDFPNFDAAR